MLVEEYKLAECRRSAFGSLIQIDRWCGISLRRPPEPGSAWDLIRDEVEKHNMVLREGEAPCKRLLECTGFQLVRAETRVEPARRHLVELSDWIRYCWRRRGWDKDRVEKLLEEAKVEAGVASIQMWVCRAELTCL